MGSNTMTSWSNIAAALLLPLASIAACVSDPAPSHAPAQDAGVPEGGGSEPIDAGETPSPDAAVEHVDPTSKSGTRLRRRYLEGGPGAQRTLDFWDAELDAACEFRTAADSELRCLPRGWLNLYYADATCSGDPLFLASEGTCGFTFGSTDAGKRMYRQTTTPRALTKYYVPYNGQCLEYTVGDLKAWAAELVPASTFVRGTVQEEPRTSGMVARFVAGEDGSRLLLSVHDTSRSSTCDFAFEPGRCLPSRRSSGGLFGDAACTKPVTSYPAGDTPDVFYERRNMVNGCLASTDYFAIGKAIPAPAPIYWRNGTGDCVQRARNASYVYYERGAPVSVSSFPASKTVLEGTGRIQAQRHVDGDGKPLGQAHAFWDSERDVPCTPGLMPDGSYRCLPSSSGYYENDTFADSSCSATPLGKYRCNPWPGPYILRAGSGSWCLFDEIRIYEDVYERGPSFDGPIYVRRYDAGCKAEDRFTGDSYFEIGPTVLPSEFPELELKTE